MKYKFTYLVFICLTLLCSFQFLKAQSQARDAVDKFIKRQEKQHQAVEYRKARKVMRGDVSHDRREDTAVLYTLEGFGGTNLYLQYLAVFINDGHKSGYAAHRIVGGKNKRILEMKSIIKNRINFETQEYLPNDASCCPSGKGKTSFTYSKRKLKESVRPFAKRKTV